MSRLINFAKKLTGRVIGERDIVRARAGEKRTRTFLGIRTETNWYMTGEDPTINETTFCWGTTLDVSHPNKTHTGWYRERSVTRFYTSDGFLREQHTEKGLVSFVGRGPVHFSYKIKEYDPPGSWIGRSIDMG